MVALVVDRLLTVVVVLLTRALELEMLELVKEAFVLLAKTEVLGNKVSVMVMTDVEVVTTSDVAAAEAIWVTADANKPNLKKDMVGKILLRYTLMYVSPLGREGVLKNESKLILKKGFPIRV